MIKNTPEQSHSTIKRVLRQTFSNRLSYYNEEQIDAGCSDRASEICKAAESLGIVLGDVSELTKQRDELLAALEYCRAVFDEYIGIHLDKTPPDYDKAARNENHRAACDAAITNVKGSAA